MLCQDDVFARIERAVALDEPSVYALVAETSAEIDEVVRVHNLEMTCEDELRRLMHIEVLSDCQVLLKDSSSSSLKLYDLLDGVVDDLMELRAIRNILNELCNSLLAELDETNVLDGDHCCLTDSKLLDSLDLDIKSHEVARDTLDNDCDALLEVLESTDAF